MINDNKRLDIYTINAMTYIDKVSYNRCVDLSTKIDRLKTISKYIEIKINQIAEGIIP